MFSTKSMRQHLSIKEKYEIISDVNKKIKYDTMSQNSNLEINPQLVKSWKKDKIVQEYEKIGPNKNVKSWKKANSNNKTTTETINKDTIVVNLKLQNCKIIEDNF